MNGVREFLIMRQTGHKSVEILRRYIRMGEIFLENAATGLGIQDLGTAREESFTGQRNSGEAPSLVRLPKTAPLVEPAAFIRAQSGGLGIQRPLWQLIKRASQK
jgi:hypothetical protein